MKKYMSILLILAIACAFSLSVVVAADMESHNFDGKFKMDVPSGSSFERSASGGVITFTDEYNGVGVVYAEDSSITPDTPGSFDQFEASSGFTEIGTDNGLHIYKKGSVYAAMKLDDGIVIVTISTEKATAIDMAKSIELI